jgi:hypothetical protein
MTTVRFLVAAVILAFGVAAQADAAHAQSQRNQKPSDRPSIMTPEPGAKQKARRNATDRSKKTGQPTRQAKERDESEPPKRRKRRIGSGSSPLPPYRSPLTPLGVAPRVIETPSVASPSSPSQIVPGISSNTGPAVTPPRPAGQGFQDRAVNCVQAGSASGVGPGQIGAYTRSCVNQ